MARRQREIEADRRGRGIWGGLGFFASLAMSAIFVAMMAGAMVIYESYRPGPLTEEVTAVVVPRGASVNRIAQHLEGEGVVRSAIAFQLAARIYAHNDSLKAGEYEFPAGASMHDVIAMLKDAKVALHRVTIAEGLTSKTIVEILADSDVLSGPVPEVPPEGTVLPETYRVSRGMDRTELLNQMMKAKSDLMDELWPARARDLPVKTKEEAIILASIVEKETGIAEERPRVAAVFVNRLRRPMRLESDPTIIYGVCKKLPERCRAGRLVDERTGEQRGIRQSEIDLNTGYNTYKIDGLPPTAIANPGRAALEAVLNPPTSNELFFVADGTGGHIFTATYAEHQKAVARWREVERAAQASR
jgi:UPF0755 protein